MKIPVYLILGEQLSQGRTESIRVRLTLVGLTPRTLSLWDTDENPMSHAGDILHVQDQGNLTK